MMRAFPLLGLILVGWGGCPSSPTTATPSGVPALTTENVSVARADIRVWGVEATSAVRQGSSTSNEQGTVNVAWSDGTTTSHNASMAVTSGTLFQDGKVCHNYGPQCYCGTTTFRFESGAAMWKFGTPSNNTPVACPSGVQPTGDAEIRKTPTAAEREATRQQIHQQRGSSTTKAQEAAATTGKRQPSASGNKRSHAGK